METCPLVVSSLNQKQLFKCTQYMFGQNGYFHRNCVVFFHSLEQSCPTRSPQEVQLQFPCSCQLLVPTITLAPPPSPSYCFLPPPQGTGQCSKQFRMLRVSTGTCAEQVGWGGCDCMWGVMTACGAIVEGVPMGVHVAVGRGEGITLRCLHVAG